MADFGDADARGRGRPAMAATDLVDHELLTIAGVGVFRLEPGGIAEWTTPLPIHPRLDPKAMLCPKHFIEACHPDDVDPVINQLQAARRAGGQGSYDYRLRTSDGRWRTFRTIYRSAPDGEAFTIIGLVQDITELADARDAALRVEQQVRGLMEESRVNARRLKLALGAAQAGVFELDHEAETFWCSPELVLLIGRQLGYEEANALPWDCVHKDDRAAVLEAAKTWMTGALLNAPLDVRIVRPDGQIRWVRLYYELKRDVRGRARRSVGLMLDIDERKRQELALVEAEKAAQAGAEAKSRFLASVSHEIRTPLNGVLGVLHLLKAERLSDEGRRLIAEALACGKMLSELINDVLDFSKIEANQLELAPEPAAVDAPRLHTEAGVVYAEPGIDMAGEVVRFRDRNVFFGGAQVVQRRDDGSLAGAGDPRRGGAVATG
jgi:signal transduction histidine kinase